MTGANRLEMGIINIQRRHEKHPRNALAHEAGNKNGRRTREWRRRPKAGREMKGRTDERSGPIERY